MNWVLVPHGKVLVPHGKVLVPHGKVLVPHGKVLVPHGKVLVAPCARFDGPMHSRMRHCSPRHAPCHPTLPLWQLPAKTIINPEHSLSGLVSSFQPRGMLAGCPAYLARG